MKTQEGQPDTFSERHECNTPADFVLAVHYYRCILLNLISKRLYEVDLQ